MLAVDGFDAQLKRGVVQGVQRLGGLQAVAESFVPWPWRR
jgi:hypothetical protein